MTINEHITTFADLPVADFGDGFTAPPATAAWRVRGGADTWDDLVADCLLPVLDAFVATPGAAEVTALVIGAWGRGYDNPTTPLVEWLVAHATALPRLDSLFIGDITFEECEISWLNQSDVTPLLGAYPGLRRLRVRGGDGLVFEPTTHGALTELAFESGGLPPAVVRNVGASSLPALTHLELWFGDENYGGDATVDDLSGVLANRFGVASYLGLRNCAFADDLAAALVTSPALATASTLDLSLGTLGDAGAEALLSGSLAHLEFLDVHHHYLSDAMVARVGALGIGVDVSGRAEEDDGDRYVAVAE